MVSAKTCPQAESQITRNSWNVIPFFQLLIPGYVICSPVPSDSFVYILARVYNCYLLEGLVQCELTHHNWKQNSLAAHIELLFASVYAGNFFDNFY